MIGDNECKHEYREETVMATGTYCMKIGYCPYQSRIQDCGGDTVILCRMKGVKKHEDRNTKLP